MAQTHAVNTVTEIIKITYFIVVIANMVKLLFMDRIVFNHNYLYIECRVYIDSSLNLTICQFCLAGIYALRIRFLFTRHSITTVRCLSDGALIQLISIYYGRIESHLTLCLYIYFEELTVFLLTTTN